MYSFIPVISEQHSISNQDSVLEQNSIHSKINVNRDTIAQLFKNHQQSQNTKFQLKCLLENHPHLVSEAIEMIEYTNDEFARHLVKKYFLSNTDKFIQKIGIVCAMGWHGTARMLEDCGVNISRDWMMDVVRSGDVQFIEQWRDDRYDSVEEIFIHCIENCDLLDCQTMEFIEHYGPRIPNFQKLVEERAIADLCFSRGWLNSTRFLILHFDSRLENKSCEQSCGLFLIRVFNEFYINYKNLPLLEFLNGLKEIAFSMHPKFIPILFLTKYGGHITNLDCVNIEMLRNDFVGEVGNLHRSLESKIWK